MATAALLLFTMRYRRRKEGKNRRQGRLEMEEGARRGKGRAKLGRLPKENEA